MPGRQSTGEGSWVALASGAVRVCAALLCIPAVGLAQAASPTQQRPPGSTGRPRSPDFELAREAENPVSDHFRVPVKNLTSFGVGPGDGVAHVFAIAPIIPVLFPDDWSVILRPILPIVVSLPEFVPGTGRTNGFGDVVLDTLGHKLIRVGDDVNLDLALGPTFSFASATHELIGSGKYAAGPMGIAGVTAGPLLTYVIVKNRWSFAGDENRADTSQFTLQPLIYFNLPRLWYLASESAIVANWEAAGEKWTVPLGVGVGKFFRIGPVPITARVVPYYNVVKPASAADWAITVIIAVMNPNPLQLRRNPGLRP